MESQDNINEAMTIPQLELLVRLGLLPLQRLPIMRRALSRLYSGVMLTPQDRETLSLLLTKFMDMTMNDPVIFSRLRTQVTQKETTMKPAMEAINKDQLKKMPEGMLNTLAANVKSKLRAGGKISPEDKRQASRAKAELRRRRDNAKDMRESYEKAFLEVLGTYGVTNVSELPNENVKEFFNKVEQLYNSGE